MAADAESGNLHDTARKALALIESRSVNQSNGVVLPEAYHSELKQHLSRFWAAYWQDHTSGHEADYRSIAQAMQWDDRAYHLIACTPGTAGVIVHVAPELAYEPDRLAQLRAALANVAAPRVDTNFQSKLQSIWIPNDLSDAADAAMEVIRYAIRFIKQLKQFCDNPAESCELCLTQLEQSIAKAHSVVQPLIPELIAAHKQTGEPLPTINGVTDSFAVGLAVSIGVAARTAYFIPIESDEGPKYRFHACGNIPPDSLKQICQSFKSFDIPDWQPIKELIDREVQVAAEQRLEKTTSRTEKQQASIARQPTEGKSAESVDENGVAVEGAGRGRRLEKKTADERQLVFERWTHFTKNYKSLGYTKASFQFFADWATDEPDDTPTDDADELKRMIDTHRHWLKLQGWPEKSFAEICESYDFEKPTEE